MYKEWEVENEKKQLWQNKVKFKCAQYKIRPWSFNSPFPVTFGSGEGGGEGGDINKN